MFTSNYYKAKNAAWRFKMTELKSTKDTTCLLNLLEKGTINHMSSLSKSNDTFTASKQNSLDFSMITHFPESTPIDPWKETLRRAFTYAQPSD